MEYLTRQHLGSQVISSARVVAIGEVLWDIFGNQFRLGGAPLNFAAHLSRLGHRATLVSAVGADKLGVDAKREISRLGLEDSVLPTVAGFPTGTAAVDLSDSAQPHFTIHRPAAYDALELSDEQLQGLSAQDPRWVYFGTLFSFVRSARSTLERLLAALPSTRRFYDVNLRSGCYTAPLVADLLAKAHAVKLNEQELETIGCLLDVPRDGMESFCRAGSARYGWEAVAVSLGARGCAIWVGGAYAEADGLPIQVSDTVGAGDAFSAAFLHGLILGWQAGTIAEFANRVGAIVASRPGAIPEWNLDEVLSTVSRPRSDRRRETWSST